MALEENGLRVALLLSAPKMLIEIPKFTSSCETACEYLSPRKMLYIPLGTPRSCAQNVPVRLRTSSVPPNAPSNDPSKALKNLKDPLAS